MNANTRANEAVTGFVCGAVIGPVWRFFWRRRTDETRDGRLADTARRLGEGVNGKIAGIKESVASRASEIKGDVREAIDAGRTAASNPSFVSSDKPTPRSRSAARRRARRGGAPL